MGLPPVAFGREREDLSPYPMFQATVDFAYDQYLGVTAPPAGTFYTVPFATSPAYIGVTQATTTGLCTDHLQSVMVSPFRRESKSSRMRKSRHPTSTDHVKHRRTRSGCLTCRRRRVKCDEAHPQCERCRKGGRECIFPSDVSKKTNALQSAKSRSHSSDREHSTIATMSDLDEESEAGDSPTEPFELANDHDHNEHARSRGRSRYPQSPHGRSESETPSCGSSRSSDASEISATDISDAQRPQRLVHADHHNDGTFADERLGFYLNYFSSHITYSNYGLVCDPDNFFESTLLRMAMIDGNHALLYGVVAFSAYQYALRHAHGGLEDFLEFYNESVTSVLHTLDGNDEATVATLITLLQLNAIEANFSDFSQLVSHHRAASELVPGVCKLDMLGDASVRAALSWYLHYDNIMSTLCDIKPQLPKHFVVSLAHAYHEKAKLNPHHDSWKLAESHAQLCLIIYDAADCRPQRDHGSGLPARSTDDQFGIQERLYAWRRSLDPTITGTQYLALEGVDLRSGGGSTPLSTPRHMPDTQTEPLSESMPILAHWHLNVLLYEGMECLSKGMQPSEQLIEHAVRICQIWSLARSRSASGSCTSLIVPLRTAILFLPQNGEYSQWIRESLAGSETLGMMMPQPLRACMANILDDQTCLHWWLPHDENMSTTVLSARVMADERWALSATHSPLSASATMAAPTVTSADSMFTNMHHRPQGHNVLLEISDAISRLGSRSGYLYPEAPLE